MIEIAKDKIAVTEMDNTNERKLDSGIIVPGEGFGARGVHPRWCKVYKVGADIKDVSVGEWILVEHGRWTYGVETMDENHDPITVWIVDYNGIMLAADERPETEFDGK